MLHTYFHPQRVCVPLCTCLYRMQISGFSAIYAPCKSNPGYWNAVDNLGFSHDEAVAMHPMGALFKGKGKQAPQGCEGGKDKVHGKREASGDARAHVPRRIPPRAVPHQPLVLPPEHLRAKPRATPSASPGFNQPPPAVVPKPSCVLSSKYSPAATVPKPPPPKMLPSEMLQQLQAARAAAAARTESSD